MRLWDIHPGYLSDRDLVEEQHHLQLIAGYLASFRAATGDSPEVRRWAGHNGALGLRHRLSLCEMQLRGLGDDSSPLPVAEALAVTRQQQWPPYLDPPGRQLQMLSSRYTASERGRIPLPSNAQQLWSQHKYSVLSRDPNRYKAFGRLLAGQRVEVSDLATRLTETLRTAPRVGGVRNAVQHMWGYVASPPMPGSSAIETWSLHRLLHETQARALRDRIDYLVASTALSELMVWLTEDGE